MHYIEESLLEGIRLHDSDTLEYIYKKFYPSVKAFVNSNSGNDDDARDIFQEAIIVIYRKVNDESFVNRKTRATFTLLNTCVRAAGNPPLRSFETDSLAKP